MFDLIMIGNIKQFVFIYIACVAEADNDVSKFVGQGPKTRNGDIQHTCCHLLIIGHQMDI